MGFYSSMQFVRDGSPCVVMRSDLLRLVESLEDLGYVRHGAFGVQLKFGDRVDLDKEPTFRMVQISPGILQPIDIAWDVSRPQLRKPHDLKVALRPRKRFLRAEVDDSIYRGHLMLGALPEQVIASCHPVTPAENNLHFAPDSMAVSIGPEIGHRLGNDEERWLGWISLAFHGNGYLYPLTEQQFISQAIKDSTIRAAAEACQRIWPDSEHCQWRWHVSESG